jgi:phosphoribosyl-ATP pyrophosphohydrolase/phosphoribosyl-AMP cyclohydrolase
MVLSVPEGVRFDAAGLVPVVVQDRLSGDVLMVAWANGEALRLSADTGQAHFWSRQRQALWRKGESSGFTMRVRELRTDCDSDAMLMVVDPSGPACHTGARACFGDETPTLAGLLAELERVIEQRGQARPPGSYTALVLEKGLDHALKKVGEEATELVLADKAESDERVASEAADLLFHVLLALRLRGVGVAAALEALLARRRRS